MNVRKCVIRFHIKIASLLSLVELSDATVALDWLQSVLASYVNGTFYVCDRDW